MSRILVHDPRALAGGAEPLLAEFDDEVVTCDDGEALATAFSARPPEVLVYVLQDLARDLELLSAIRNAAPRLPIILLGEPATLQARRCIQDLRPTYYGVFPLDPTELAEAVGAALGSASHRMGSGFRS